MFTALTIIWLLLNLTSSELVGPITISEYGENVVRYVVSSDPTKAKISSNKTLTIQHNGNIQIAANSSNSYSPNMFAMYKLSGSKLSFDIDLSTISCSCNVAFYMVGMPAIGSNGEPTPGNSGTYYCDANGNNGYCWDMDIIESNQYTLQTTAHKCGEPPGGIITNCDTIGCGTNAYNVNKTGMCPSDNCIINTLKKFRFEISFSLNNINVVMKQGDNNNNINNNNNSYDSERKYEYSVCGNTSYIEEMSNAEDYGMVFIMSYWGDDYNTMQWLDGMTGCTGDCDQKGTAIIANISIDAM